MNNQQCENNEVALGRAHQLPQRRLMDLASSIASHHLETVYITKKTTRETSQARRDSWPGPKFKNTGGAGCPMMMIIIEITLKGRAITGWCRHVKAIVRMCNGEGIPMYELTSNITEKYQVDVPLAWLHPIISDFAHEINFLHNQLLCNSVGGVKFIGERIYECVYFNVVSVTRGWMGITFSEKNALCNTLMALIRTVEIFSV